MAGAFDHFAKETGFGVDKELTRKEFYRFLQRHWPALPRDDYNEVNCYVDRRLAIQLHYLVSLAKCLLTLL